jgi:WD40 repeat protein
LRAREGEVAIAMAGTATEIDIGTQPFDLAFHPSANLVAVATITGYVHLYKYGDPGGEVAQLWRAQAHSESCRAVRFAQGGEYMLSASPDKSILATNVETGQAVARLADAHAAAINRLVNCGDTTVASGDDEGTIKVWDTRQNKCCNSFDAHEDFIADMEFLPGSNQLLGASGDGTLSICNLRRNRIDSKTQFAEDELLSVVVCKHGQKVICGSQDGVLLLYSWGAMADCSDRFLGHPNSVDAMLKVDEDTLLTGSSDGIIRIVSILPNKMIGVIGEHADFPVERLGFSHDRNTLGSASHDNSVKLWDVRYLHEDEEVEDAGEEEAVAAAVQPAVAGSDSDDQMEVEESKQRKKKGKEGKQRGGASSNNFFDDL